MLCTIFGHFWASVTIENAEQRCVPVIVGDCDVSVLCKQARRERTRLMMKRGLTSWPTRQPCIEAAPNTSLSERPSWVPSNWVLGVDRYTPIGCLTCTDRTDGRSYVTERTQFTANWLQIAFYCSSEPKANASQVLLINRVTTRGLSVSLTSDHNTQHTLLLPHCWPTLFATTLQLKYHCWQAIDQLLCGCRSVNGHTGGDRRQWRPISDSEAHSSVFVVTLFVYALIASRL